MSLINSEIKPFKAMAFTADSVASAPRSSLVGVPSGQVAAAASTSDRLASGRLVAKLADFGLSNFQPKGLCCAVTGQQPRHTGSPQVLQMAGRAMKAKSSMPA